VGITAGSREVPGRNVCDRRHTYCIIIIIIIIIVSNNKMAAVRKNFNVMLINNKALELGV